MATNMRFSQEVAQTRPRNQQLAEEIEKEIQVGEVASITVNDVNDITFDWTVDLTTAQKESAVMVMDSYGFSEVA